MQTIEETYTQLLQKDNYRGVLLWLKGLTNADKKTFAPMLKKLAKEYLEPVGVETKNSYSFTYKANERQRIILAITAFVCLNRLEVDKLGVGWQLFEQRRLDDVLPWYCPAWFNDFVNNTDGKNRSNFRIDYLYLLSLQQQQYLTPSPELVLQVLPNSIFVYHIKEKLLKYTPQVLLQYPITLQKHIWYLFQYPSNVNWLAERVMQQGTVATFATWQDVFITFTGEGRLDRQLVLQEALLTGTRNFDKNLTGWFVELVNKMKPSQAELITLQPELFALLYTTHRKAVSAALQYLKLIVQQNQFDAARLIEAAPVLLAAETKQIVTQCLQLLEKTAKQYPALTNDVCAAICHAFIHKDDALQTRAATLLKKLRPSTRRIITDNIAPYQTSLLVKTKELLQAYLPAEKPLEVEFEPRQAQEQPAPVETTAQPKRLIPISYPTSVEDLVFLASQAFNNNQPWHVDVLPAACVNLHKQVLAGGNLNAFEPALQRAFALAGGDYRATQGYLDNLLATFFIEYCRLLVTLAPQQAAGLKKVEENHFEKQHAIKAKWAGHVIRVVQLVYWKISNNEEVYQIHKQLMLLAFKKLETGNTLPLLATPTHEPAWIDPCILIDRLALYQHAGQKADDIDLQVALTRCQLTSSAQALAYAPTRLTGDMLALMQFLLDKPANPPASIQRPGLCMAAALAKNPGELYPDLHPTFFNNIAREKLTGQYQWQPAIEHYTEHKWDAATRKMVKVPATQPVLELYIPSKQAAPAPPPAGIVKKLLGLFSSKAAVPAATSTSPGGPLIYAFERIHSRHLIILHNDAERLMYLFANNPEPLLASITREALKHVTFYSETEKRIVIGALKALHHLFKPGMGQMAHVFLAACMLTNDKTTAALAAEIWVASVNDNGINSSLIGHIAGILLAGELAPVKRTSDLVEGCMLGISPRHNEALLNIFNAMLSRLPTTPLKGLKKLLELYLEVLAIATPGTVVISTSELADNLAAWKQTASLSKTIVFIEGKLVNEGASKA